MVGKEKMTNKIEPQMKTWGSTTKNRMMMTMTMNNSHLRSHLPLSYSRCKNLNDQKQYRQMNSVQQPLKQRLKSAWIVEDNIEKYCLKNENKLNNIVIYDYHHADNLNIADNRPIEQSIDRQYRFNNLLIHSNTNDRHWSMKRISNLVIILALFIIVTPAAIHCDIFSSTATIQSLMHL